MAEGIFASGVDLVAPDGRVILKGAGFEMPEGGRGWIEGPPGSGKRAVLKVLAGLLPPQSGEVRLRGERLWPGGGISALGARTRLGFGFPQGGLLSNQSLRENLALPLRFIGRKGKELDEAVDGVLDRLGLSEDAPHRPHALSVRIRQLAQLARIELLQPQVIFMSEPFTDLEGPDLAHAETLLGEWNQDPTRLILVSSEKIQPGLFNGLQRFRLETGKLHAVEGAP